MSIMSIMKCNTEKEVPDMVPTLKKSFSSEVVKFFNKN